MSSLLESLNEPQRRAVQHGAGPLLILAGAGSGKTRVITTRIAWLIDSGQARPDEIVAVTFTNKAAGEMKERVARLVGERPEGGDRQDGIKINWIGTFHAMCLRILRREGALVGYAPGFLVYDTADQLSLLRTVMREQGLDDTPDSARSILHRISAAKNRLQTVEDVETHAGGPAGQHLAGCYRAYQEGLRKNNAADFDDLLLQTILLFEKFPGTARRYAASTRFLLVDEYQDTNRAQYRFIRLLTAEHRNLCCVGDEDQSIYRFRGADIANILDFRKDYPEAEIIKLEQNYRSTRTILAAATAVIGRNTERIGKTLWTENAEGELIDLHVTPDDRAEAEGILQALRALQREGRRLDDVAVLYRTNNQSRLFEEVFLRERLPHRVVGALRFYERKEIKDLVAYLRVTLNAADDISLSRIVNVPARGIGKGTIDAVEQAARAGGLSLRAAMDRVLDERTLPARAAKSLADFLALLEELRGVAAVSGLVPMPEDRQAAIAAEAERSDGGEAGAETLPADSRLGVTDLLGLIMNRIAYAAHLEKNYAGDHEARLQNIDALISAAAEYDEEGAPEGLQGFVDRSSLRSDTDDVSGDSGVTLMTIHSAKGLEFPVVIVSGMEETVFPHVRSSESRAELEEERRLFYVAVTRAREQLVLTSAMCRRSFGDFVENPPSRFLEEIPPDLLRTRRAAASSFRSLSPAGYTPWRSPRSVRDGRPAPPLKAPATRAAGGRPGPVVHYDEGGDDDYAVGMKVTHPMFGKGTIAAVEGSGTSVKLTIRFTESGVRKILPRHTTLTIGR